MSHQNRLLRRRMWARAWTNLLAQQRRQLQWGLSHWDAHYELAGSLGVPGMDKILIFMQIFRILSGQW